MRQFGLVGYPLAHSFSKDFFEKKFSNENLKNVGYVNLESPSLEDLFNSNKLANLDGFNVTIPYKESILPYLDGLSSEAKAIGAINCVKNEKGKLIGYNTDHLGFYHSINPLLKSYHNKALVLGNGGATKAIVYALKQANIEYQVVSRNSSFDYKDIDQNCLEKYTILINCTPLGTYPRIEEFPQIPYQYLTKNHLLFDLVYNPTTSRFLKYGKQKQCLIKNGLEMLEIQAEKSWEIWNGKNYTY